jgi:excisionase family DNA binding protein
MKEKGGLIRMNIVTAKEVGEFLKLTESTIYNLALNGELPGFKIGKSWRSDMEEILEQIGISNEQKKKREIKENDGITNDI